MKSVYIESSVISYITARPSRDVVTSARQAITIEWWETYKDSFEVLISENAIPASSTEDALHISIAAVQDIDFLLTWNFKHINNANTRDKIAQVINRLNFRSPVLCSPEELINER
ncbi:MAG: hypothetical protein NTX45_11625 [Proteobacteria bacterium]|nr:hypothetical protein [Pseudomonadota bacterium]